VWRPVPGFIFINYSRQDTDYVTHLAQHFRQAGVPVWLDTDRINYGDRWEHAIPDQVDVCAAVVVVMSPTAEASLHVGNELHRAGSRASRSCRCCCPVLGSSPWVRRIVSTPAKARCRISGSSRAAGRAGRRLPSVAQVSGADTAGPDVAVGAHEHRSLTCTSQ
jgi:hypothetical protein